MLRSTGFTELMSTPQTQLLSNHDFVASTAGWTAVDGTAFWFSANLAGLGADTIGTPSSMYQDITTVIGEVYEVEINANTPNTNVEFALSAQVNSPIPYDLFTDYRTQLTTFANYKSVFVATGTDTRLSVHNSALAATDAISFTYISCKRVGLSTLSILRDFKINIYDGTQPASPDDVPGATLLCTVTDNDTGSAINLDTDVNATPGILQKSSSDTWSGTVLSSGIMGWGRLYVAVDDPSTASTTFVRVDFSIGLTGSDVNLSSLSILVGGLITIPTFVYTESN